MYLYGVCCGGESKQLHLQHLHHFQIKNHMWVFVNCLIVNPTFDSQTKENMTLQVKSFGSKCALTEKFVNSVMKCGIVEAILTWAKFKQQAQLQSKCTTQKRNKLKGMYKGWRN